MLRGAAVCVLLAALLLPAAAQPSPYRLRTAVTAGPATVHVVVMGTQTVHARGRSYEVAAVGLSVSADAVALAETAPGRYEGDLASAPARVRARGPAGESETSLQSAGQYAAASAQAPRSAGSAEASPASAQASPATAQAPPSSEPVEAPRVTLRLESSPRVGDNVLIVEAVDVSGGPLRMRAALWMPGQAVGTVPQWATADGPGRWTLPVRFDRSGAWVATVDVESGAEKLSRRSLSIAVPPPAIPWTGRVGALLLCAALVALVRRRPVLAMGAASTGLWCLGPAGLAQAPYLPPPHRIPVVLEQPRRGPMFSRLTAAATVVSPRVQVVLAEVGGLLLGWDVAEGASVRAGQAVAQTSAGTIAAPFSGAVTRRLAEVGAALRPHESALFELAETDPVLLEARIPRADRVAPGMPVNVLLPGEPPGRGVIERVSPLVDDAAQTVGLEVRFPNPALSLRLGEQVPLEVVSAASVDALSVPASAIHEAGADAWVWRIDDVAGQLVARHRPVQIGMGADDRVEIRQGLAASDRVVVDGDVNEDDTLVTPVAADPRPSPSMSDMP